MRQMEFHSLDVVQEEDETSEDSKAVIGDHRRSVFEQYRERAMEESLDGSGSPPKGREVRGKFERLASANHAVQQTVSRPTPLIRSSSADATMEFKDVDLIDFKSGDARQVLEEDAMKRWKVIPTSADAVAVSLQPDVHLMDNDVYNVQFSDRQAGHSSPPAQLAGHENALQGDCIVTNKECLNPGPANMISRSSSTHSTSSGRSEDGHSASEEADGDSSRFTLKDEEKGSPATNAYNRAFNKIMRQKKMSALKDGKHPKTMRKPLLAPLEEEKLEQNARKDAKKEAKRVAEEAKKDAEKQQRELRELANPVPESALDAHKEPAMLAKASKQIHKFLNTHGFHFKAHKESLGHADTREAKLPSLFADCTSPEAAVALAQIRLAPSRQNFNGKDLKFATVESQQRDVPAWTMEEYMEKNARLTEWKAREEDEDFGGIEGKNLMNNFFNNDQSDIDGDDSDDDDNF